MRLFKIMRLIAICAH